MEEHFIYKNGKKLKYGYTTGSCATAAAKAATIILLTGKTIDTIKIATPKGWDLILQVIDIHRTKDTVSCTIVKDGGDDPDITSGLKIIATVKKNSNGEINISGGKGVGIVTKKGLGIEIGKSAINKTPLKTIHDEVLSITKGKTGIDVEISVPKGEEIAKKTLNGKLGIIGGISIIGTSGIVEPMSEEAFKDSLAVELKMAVSEGEKKVVFVPGNYGIDFCKANKINDNVILRTSNFIGFMLEKACEYGIEEIILVGHIGKLIKVAGGIFHTHSKMADARMEILVAHLVEMGAATSFLQKILHSNTTEEAVGYIVDTKYEKVFELIVQSIKRKCQERVYGKLSVEVILFSSEIGELAHTQKIK